MRVFILLVLVSALTIGQTAADSSRKGLRGNNNALEKRSMEASKQKADESADLLYPNAPAVSGTGLLAVHSKAPMWPCLRGNNDALEKSSMEASKQADASAGLLDPKAPAVSGTGLLAVHSKAPIWPCLRGNNNALEKSSMEESKQKADASADLLGPNAPAVSGTGLLAVHSKAPIRPSEEIVEALTKGAMEGGAVSGYILDPWHARAPAAPFELPKGMADDLRAKFKKAGGNDEGFSDFLVTLLKTVKPLAIKIEETFKRQVFEVMKRAKSGRPGEISAEHEVGLKEMCREVFDEEAFQKFLQKCDEEFKAMSAEDRDRAGAKNKPQVGRGISRT